MCGFFLSLHSENKKLFQKSYNNLNLNHRGPDQFKFFTFDINVNIYDQKPNKLNEKFFGFFNRLSIRGLKSIEQQQPSFNQNQDIFLFNGEIYNCEFLKKKFNLISDVNFVLQGLN